MLKVLIVDDEKKACKLLAELILSVKENAEIATATCPGVALDMIAQNDYDLIFVDIQMPQMNGIEMIREIKKKEKKPFISMISAYDKFEYAQHAMENGSSAYLLKPFTKERVEQIVDIYRKKCSPLNDDIIVLNKSTGQFPVKISSIVAVEKVDRGIISVYGVNFDKMQVRGTLIETAKKLPSNFRYLNRQCIINLHAIRSFNPKARRVVLNVKSGEFAFVCSRGNIKQIAASFNESRVNIFRPKRESHATF